METFLFSAFMSQWSPPLASLSLTDISLNMLSVRVKPELRANVMVKQCFWLTLLQYQQHQDQTGGITLIKDLGPIHAALFLQTFSIHLQKNFLTYNFRSIWYFTVNFTINVWETLLIKAWGVQLSFCWFSIFPKNSNSYSITIKNKIKI